MLPGGDADAQRGRTPAAAPPALSGCTEKGPFILPTPSLKVAIPRGVPYTTPVSTATLTLVCVRCQGPIGSGTPYVPNEEGAPIHWACSLGALGAVLEGTGNQIGAGRARSVPPKEMSR